MKGIVFNFPVDVVITDLANHLCDLPNINEEILMALENVKLNYKQISQVDNLLLVNWNLLGSLEVDINALLLGITGCQDEKDLEFFEECLKNCPEWFETMLINEYDTKEMIKALMVIKDFVKRNTKHDINSIKNKVIKK